MTDELDVPCFPMAVIWWQSKVCNKGKNQRVQKQPFVGGGIFPQETDYLRPVTK